MYLRALERTPLVAEPSSTTNELSGDPSGNYQEATSQLGSGSASYSTDSDTSLSTFQTNISASGESCPRTFAHLGKQLPHYADPELQKVRQQALNTDLRETLAAARTQGHSVAEAARLSLKQAQAYEAAMPDAEACIRAARVDSERVINRLQKSQTDCGNDDYGCHRCSAGRGSTTLFFQSSDHR